MGKVPAPQGEEGSGDHAQPCRRAAAAGTRGLRRPGTLLVPGGRRRGGCSPPRGRAVTALCCVAVHGAWEEWSPWSLCSVTCGRGARTRTRRCVAPRHGGKACEGPELQAKPCNIATCPGQYRSPPLPLLPPGRVPTLGRPGKATSRGARALLPVRGLQWHTGRALRPLWHRHRDLAQPRGTGGRWHGLHPPAPMENQLRWPSRGTWSPPPRAGGDSPGACWQLGWRGDVVGHREGLWGLCVRGWQRRHCFFILLARSQPGGLFWGWRLQGHPACSLARLEVGWGHEEQGSPWAQGAPTLQQLWQGRVPVARGSCRAPCLPAEPLPEPQKLHQLLPHLPRPPQQRWGSGVWHGAALGAHSGSHGGSLDGAGHCGAVGSAAVGPGGLVPVTGPPWLGQGWALPAPGFGTWGRHVARLDPLHREWGAWAVGRRCHRPYLGGGTLMPLSRCPRSGRAVAGVGRLEPLLRHLRQRHTAAHAQVQRLGPRLGRVPGGPRRRPRVLQPHVSQ